MRTEMIMPQMGESIAEATILKWLKNVGDNVNKDETILEISTDKVDSEIPAPASGKIVEIVANEGDTVPVKSVIAVIDSAADAEVSAPAASAAEAKASSPQQAPAPQAETPSPAQALSAAPAQQPASAIPSHVAERFYSPLVRSLAAQHNLSTVDLAQIPGTGTNKRVTKEDVLLFLENRNSGGSTSVVPEQPAPRANGAESAGRPSPSPAPVQAPPAASLQYEGSGVRVETMGNMRKLIAEHMVRSKATSPHVYSMAEVDISRVAKWRKSQQSAFLKREGFKLSFTPFFLEAAVKAIQSYPQINVSIDGDSIIYKRDINLGCAVALGKDGLDGLIVPVIKDAGSLSLAGIARSLNDLAQRARDKKLKPQDVQDGTFTVTNPGIFGNIFGCPIINQPQVAILALGAIKKRPVVIDDAIAIREMIILTMSYDHRIVDGALAGHFMRYMTQYLEGWNMDRAV